MFKKFFKGSKSRKGAALVEYALLIGGIALISAGAVSLEISMALAGRAIPEPIDFSHAFLVVALFTLAAAPIALWMPRNAGDELTGRRSVRPQTARGAAD